MFLSKKLLFERWQPQVKEYYWEVSGASSASLPSCTVVYAGPTKIYYCGYNSGYTSGLVGTIDLTTTTPTVTSTAGQLFFNSGVDGDATHCYSYGWLKASSGFYAYKGVVDTTTDEIVLTSFDATSYPIQNRGVMATMIGDTIIWTTGRIRTVSSSQGSLSMATNYIYSGTTNLVTSVEGRSSNYGIIGKTTPTSVLANTRDGGYIVSTTAATSSGAQYTGFILNGENYSVSNTATVTTAASVSMHPSAGQTSWTHSFYGGPTGDEPMFATVLGCYKRKLYFVIGPKTQSSTTTTLELVELDASSGNELHRMTLPVPQVCINGVASAYQLLYGMSYSEVQKPMDSKNGYFAVPLTEVSDFNGMINNGTGYHDWFLIKVPE